MTDLVLQDLLRDLELLTADIQQLPSTPKAYQAAFQRSIEEDYRSLHAKCQTVSLSTAPGLTYQQKTLAQFLELGSAAFDQFHSTLLPLIHRDPTDTETAVAKFVASSAGFRHVNSKAQTAMSASDMVVVQDSLGGVLGVAVGEEFVRSLRGEMLGRVIAYAFSGLCQHDLLDYASDPSLQSRFPNRDSFLLHRIKASESDLVYAIGTPEAGSANAPLACLITENSPLTDRIKPALHADHCVVNHHTKTITFGATTTNQNADKDQTRSAMRLIAALQLMVEQGSSTTNPYHGYTIRPFYYHSGTMAVEEVMNDRQRSGGAMLTMLESRGAVLSAADHRALANMAFFSLLGEGHPNAAVGATLALLNVNIGGCDTLDLYHAMSRAREFDAPDRAFAALALTHLSQALDVLGRPDTHLSLTATGQNHLEPLLLGVVNATANHFLNFPVGDPAQITAAERLALEKITTNLASLGQKIDADGSGLGGDLSNRIRHLVSDTSGPTQIDAWARHGRRTADATFSWSKEQEDILKRRAPPSAPTTLRQGALEARREQLISAILRDVQDKKMPAVLTDAVNVALGDPRRMGQRATFTALAAQAKTSIEGGPIVTFLPGQTHANHLIYAMKDIRRNSEDGHPAAAVVTALQAFCRDDWWSDNRVRLLTDPLARHRMGKVVDQLLDLRVSPPGSPLSASLDALARQRIPRRAPKSAPARPAPVKKTP